MATTQSSSEDAVKDYADEDAPKKSKPKGKKPMGKAKPKGAWHGG